MTRTRMKKSKSTQSLAVRRAVAMVLASTAAARAAQLPVPCAAGTCGTHATSWTTTPGAASYVQSGNQLNVTQKQNSVVLNWQSFNISKDGTVNFVQPSSTSVALNQIYDVNKSLINGMLNANGHVYLLNQNGFLFGPNAVVNVGGLLASSLNINPDAIKKGIAGLTTTNDGPAFQPYVDASGHPVTGGSITVQSGAQITSDQGQVLLFAPTVDNEGSIQTPSGQTILGAGQRVFLAAATDGIVRGLVIEVGDGGTVTNGNTGQILATAGNVTLAGLAVNQNGRVSATTTVRSNGSIRLQARDTSATFIGGGGSVPNLPDRSGTLVLGPSSETSVTLEGGSTDTTVDANLQPKSDIQLYGGTIQLQDHASILAPGGNVTLDAVDKGLDTPGHPKLGDVATTPDPSRIYLAPTSTIDVSGADVSLPMDANSLAVQLRGSEFADFPQQRNGPLRGQTVYVDLRQYGTRSDGSPWIGTPIADLSGDVSTIQRDVFERNLTGGKINLNSSGSVIVSQGATLNVSGGRIDYQSGYVKSSMLVGADGKTSSIATADPNATYWGTLDAITQSDPHWGTSVTVTLPIHDSSQGQYQAGYTEGKDAGTVSIIAPAAVLDGTFNGGVTVGPYQRLAPTDPKTNPTTWPVPGQLYRPYDQVPVGGTLILGNAVPVANDTAIRQVLQNVTFATGAVLNTLTGANGKPFDPTIDPLPANFVTSVRPELLGAGGTANLKVYAEGGITVPAGVTLAPGPGGSVILNAGRVDFAGTIDIPGGAATLSAAPTIAHPADAAIPGADQHGGLPSLVLEPGSRIDVSGEWINDDPGVSGGATPPLFTSGGLVSLSSNSGSLVFPGGAVINASGGAQRTASGSLVPGKGGAITIAAGGVVVGTDQPQFVVDGLIESYALNTGGSLTLALPQLCVSDLPCTDQGAIRTDPSLFTDFGFGNVTLSATLGSLTVASDVNVAAAQQNLLFLPAAFSRPSARSLADLTSRSLLPENLRKPENVTFTSSAAKLVSVDQPVPYALTIADGARIALDPGGSLKFMADSKILQDGILIAPGGQVTLQLGAFLNNSDGVASYVPNQAIWLGPHSLIDVSGIVQTTPNDLNLDLGSVLSGGSISVDANAGYLFAAPGSSLKAAGATGTLDLRSPGQAAYTRTQVGSAGGSIALGAAEGILFDGSLSAAAGAGFTTAGGSLSVTLFDPMNQIGAASRLDPDYPVQVASTPRDLTVSAASSPTIVAEGSAVPDFLNGLGRISATTINAGGFDNVTLKVRNLSASGGFGSVTFDSGVTLSPAAQLVVDAPQIRAGVAGGVVTLTSDYVALGSTDTFSQAIKPNPTNGTSNLQVSGKLVDLVGAFELNGFNAAQITSSGDMRAVGVQSVPNGPQYLGALTVPGSLTLAAQQIYPTTLTNYSINVVKDGTKSSLLTVDGMPGQAGDVLSAAGSLALQADQIADSGVLRAPMGSLAIGDVDTQSVTLSPGAILSVSANGLTIPFGETQGGFDWVYQLQTGSSNPLTQVYGVGAGDVLPPQKQITLTAGKVTTDKGATIDLSGGGDLVAYEYVPGLGGNADVLAPKTVRNNSGTSTGRGTFAPDVFAIVPTADLAYAPIDPHEDLGFANSLAGAGFTQTYGASVHLSGGDGLPAGTYTILPARYALLTGAYLVKPVSGYTNLAPGQTVSQLDGSVIVSGYRTYGSTGLRDTQTSGWDITQGTYALQEAQYTLNYANKFFTDQATAANVSAPRIPSDAGALAIQVSSQAALNGKLITTAATGARGATVDLSGLPGSNANIVITTGDQQVVPQGWVAFDAGQLNSLGAESLLIGGTRSAEVNATTIHIDANNVEVDQGVQLSGQELILAANQKLSIDAGASVQATGAPVAAETAFQLVDTPSAAVVRVSTGSLTGLQLKSTSATGTQPTLSGGQINVASGAVLGAPGSASIDAGGAVDFAGNLAAAGAAIRLGANQFALGAVPQDFNGFAISPALAAGIANSNLTLSSPDKPLLIYGAVVLALDKLNIDAPGILDEAGLGAVPDGALSVSASDVALVGQTAAPFTSAATGSVQLSATHITLAGGFFSVAGSTNTVLSASQDITATADGTLAVQTGALHLDSAVMQSAAGVNYNFTSPGAVTTALAGTASGATAASGPGGALSFTGSSVTLGGNIILPAGQVTAIATGSSGSRDVTVADGATINVAGFAVNFDGEIQSASGGAINLTSTSGSVNVAPTAILDVSAGTGAASGGSLAMIAPMGTATLGGQLRAAGGSGQSGAGLTIDALALGAPTACGTPSCEFSSLVTAADAAGFTGQWNIHERGVSASGYGNLVLQPGSTIRASGVSLTTDQGNVQILGTIDASSTLGGTIVLSGQNIEIYGTGSLLAGSTTRADRGGTIDLFSNGGLVLDAGSQLSVGGAGSIATGTLWLRTQSQDVLSVLPGQGPAQVSLAGNISGAANVYLEGFTRYSKPTITLGDGDMQVGSTYYNDAQTFYNSATTGPMTIAQALGRAKDTNFTVLPGVEIDATNGDLTVQASQGNFWDLSQWRFGPNSTVPGVLTLRASGNLNVNTSILDGITCVNCGLFSPVQENGAATGASWSYRFAAGANIPSANPLSVVSVSEVGPQGGNFVVAKGNTAIDPGTFTPTQTAIVTGTGSIDIAAAGNVQLSNQASVIYTTGVARSGDPQIDLTNNNSAFQDLPYPTGGGSITVSAGRDVVGAPSSELFIDWLWRTGGNGVATSWTPSVSLFEQGIGALGGGDVTVTAGRNVADLGANVASVGRPTSADASATTQELDNGVLRVTAGGDISGGKFLDMAGLAFIRAGGALNAGSPQSGSGNRGLYAVIAVGSGQFDVTARRGVSIETVLDPTLLPQSDFEYTGAQSVPDTFFFATYSDSSRVTLRSVGSDVVLVNQSATKNSQLQLSTTDVKFDPNADNVNLRLFAPNLAAVSLGGNVRVDGSMDLWPSAHGNLDLLAADSVLFQPADGNGLHVLMSDSNPNLLPTLGNVLTGGFSSVSAALANLDNVTGHDSVVKGNLPSHAASPVHGGAFSPDKQPDDVPARIVAQSGDVSILPLLQPGAAAPPALISIPKQLDVIAGQDISNLTLDVQQFAANNVSTVIAGRDIVDPTSRLADGTLAPSLGAFVFDGPGHATISAGRNINLGTSDGIISEGNLHNTALPTGGASVTVEAGVPENPNYQTFIDTYLAQSDTYDQALIQYMEGINGALTLTKAQALAQFTALPTTQQTQLVDTLLFDELRAGGRFASGPPPDHNNFTRAFDALTTLFPGSNPNLGAGEVVPYKGDILLYFSRISTLQGGDINLLAPGGQINVGLASAPTAFGVAKSPSQLGIVAERTGSVDMLAYNDIQVNQSRVFAADGGNILMWTTEGGIDAGRGAKTAISAPPPTVTIDPNTGAVTVNFPPALTGSGIQALATSTGTKPGDVDLFAPHGVVNANDAGIVAGNLTIVATAVLGANNISFSGTAVGLPPAVPALGATTSSAAATGSAASSVGEANATESGRADKAPLANTALGWLDVFVLGLGDEQCKTEDVECLKRQKHL